MPKIPIEDKFTFGTGIVVVAIAVGLYSCFNKSQISPIAERVLEQYDSNGNKALEIAELSKALKITYSESEKVLLQYDKDKSEALDIKELSNLFKEYNPRY